MTAAAIPQIVSASARELSPAEIVAGFTGTDLLAASTETSPIYDGLVISKAVAIVQHRLRCRNLLELKKRLNVSKTTLYRAYTAQPVLRHATFERLMSDLAVLLFEEGIRL